MVFISAIVVAVCIFAIYFSLEDKPHKKFDELEN